MTFTWRAAILPFICSAQGLFGFGTRAIIFRHRQEYNFAVDDVDECYIDEYFDR